MDYLVGWSHKKNDIGVYRIDRIAAPKTDPNRKREKESEGFNIREYTEQVFGMYTGTKTVNAALPPFHFGSGHRQIR